MSKKHRKKQIAQEKASQNAAHNIAAFIGMIYAVEMTYDLLHTYAKHKAYFEQELKTSLLTEQEQENDH